MTTRRKFLAFIGAAPIAAPAALKEAAAAKMGIRMWGAPAGGGMSMGANVGYAMAVPSQDLNWLRKRLADVRARAEERRQYLARECVVLDADLASLRSMSPSVARTTQIDREIERWSKREEIDLQKEIDAALSRATGGLL